ncbi:MULTISPECIES: ammonia-dependent NAD(+) synthetase [Carnobacterium]|uniref:NH(3)-dependent NAD(+) synthetase n=2 Tax=Carnobacterium TaxID=2747 RepID=A0A1H1ALB1_9LACT|nr:MULTISPECIES: ammonia-dependent NAD(+) synthetase [Carnobacterium]MBC9825780.1 ammonia-dependent NAD(+) synthetase [Carnobacterium inhibens]MDN5372330.1 synthase [Carnobacterium sp.]UDE96147.1 ammonia-dependent NAD(+) synthetase [Carnobacterium viridans]SDQ40417.1 NH(3)-dependent NAD(+) synthetase [Carnobacterium viridans]
MTELRNQIIKAMQVKPSIDPKEEIRKSVDFLKAYLKKHSFLKTLVLGISGGQDSTLVGKLGQIAVNELREETGDISYQFIAIRLPYGEQADEKDAMDAIEFIGADKVVKVNVKPGVDATVQTLEESGTPIKDFVKGNIKARQRMIIQYAIAGSNNGAVLGTDHSAESITGFYTKFGDGGTDINPIFRLNKRQGKALLKELGAPKHLYEKVPTADLEEDKPSLPDEMALGVTYDQIDDYLEGKEIAEAAAQTIESWYVKTEHKRHLPITIFDDFWK